LHWLDSGNQNNLQKKFKGEAMLCTICNVPLVPKSVAHKCLHSSFNDCSQSWRCFCFAF